uniref:Serine-threonine/tyrosine-protein kinase catalytic domain-containing protein n=1 Tax=Acrobeloides nanus TaxID=290746 RepID=A0A914ENW8_9BILA
MVYYCHKCRRNVTVDNNMQCTDCHDGFIEEFPGNGKMAEEADNTGLIAGPSQSPIQAKQKPGKIDLSINAQPEFLDLTKIPEVQDINKIIFPETPDQVYDFKSGQYSQDFQEMDTLGSGKFTVKSFLFKPFMRQMAIKFIHIPHNRYNTNDENSRRVVELIREISNFRKLSQAPNIVNCFGVCIYEGQALICMEQMDMSLKEVYLRIHELKKPLTPMEDDDSTKTLTQEDVDKETAKDSKMEVEEPETLKAQENTSPTIIFPEELLAYVAVALLDALVACQALICMEQMDMSLKEVYLKIHELKKPLTSMEDDDSTKTLTQEDVDKETAKDSKMEVEEPETLKAQENTSPAIIFPEELLAYVAVALLDALAACKKENELSAIGHPNASKQKKLNSMFELTSGALASLWSKLSVEVSHIEIKKGTSQATSFCYKISL